MQLKLLGMLVLAALAVPVAFAADKEEKPADKTAAAPKEAPKKLPHRQDEYKDWGQAKAVAEAYEQPILVYVELSGDKRGVAIRNKIFAKADLMKDLSRGGLCYYHLMVPQYHEKAKKGQRPPRRDKNTPPKPDFDKLKGENRHVVSLVNAQSRLPMVALVDHKGRLIAGGLVSEDDEYPVMELAEALTSRLGSKYPNFKLGHKVEKAVAAEKKAKAQAEKNAK